MSRRPPFAHPIRLVVAVVIVVGLVAGGFILLRDDGAPPTAASKLAGDERIFSNDDPLERACDLSERILLRSWRGDY
jgi:hypothetical protein